MYFTFRAPLALTLLFTCTQQVLCILPRRSGWRTAVMTLSIMVHATGAILGGVWAAPFLRCLGVACVDPTVYTAFQPPQPEAGMGWQAIIGMSALIAFSALGSVQLARFVASAGHRAGQEAKSVGGQLLYDIEQMSLVASAETLGGASGVEDIVLPVGHGATLRWGWLLYLLLAPLTTVFFFFTTYIPNSWEFFMPDRMAAFAAQKVTHDLNVSTYPDYISYPEYSWATFKTGEVVLRDYWRLKIFPGNVFLYVFLMGVPLLALTLQSVPWLRAHLTRGVWIVHPEYFYASRPTYLLRKLWPGPPAHPPPQKSAHLTFITFGTMLVAATVALLSSLWLWYWLHDHNYNSNWPCLINQTTPYDIDHVPCISYAEIVARAFGQLAVLLFSLLMFPAARNSVLPYMFGVSWEAAIAGHIILGRLFLLFAGVHMVANYVWYSKTNNFPTDIMAIPMHLSTSIDNFTVPIISLVTWLSFITMGVLGLWTIRRRFFELFYYAHHITYCLLIPTVLWHAAAGWEFLLPGVALWFVDRCMRAYRSASSVSKVQAVYTDIGLAGRVTSLYCHMPMDYSPGQYIFLNVAEISLFEWHPFTIAGASAGLVELHIKAIGKPTSFTNRLADTVRDSQPLTVSVDGPYGLSKDFHPYAQICLMAGGIGITPCKAIFEALSAHQLHFPRLQRVILLWAARDRKLLELLYPAIVKLAPSEGFHVHFYQTASPISDTPSLNADTSEMCPTYFGRPELDDVAVLEKVAAGPTLMFACGPRPMTLAAELHARTHHWDFHTETFEL